MDPYRNYFYVSLRGKKIGGDDDAADDLDVTSLTAGGSAETALVTATSTTTTTHETSPMLVQHEAEDFNGLAIKQQTKQLFAMVKVTEQCSTTNVPATSR